LKELFTKTSTPTIEERSALALEIGMYVIHIGRNLQYLIIFTGMSEKLRIGSGICGRLLANERKSLAAEMMRTTTVSLRGIPTPPLHPGLARPRSDLRHHR